MARSILPPDQPRAEQRSVVVADRVRVTVLTERLLRLEYAADRYFEDRPSLAVVNRRFPAVDFTVAEHAGGVVVVDTGAIKLSLSAPAKPFSRTNLSARIGEGRKHTTWHYGQKEKANLGGTRRTLDGWKGNERQEFLGIDMDKREYQMGDWKTQSLDPGLLSRDGWVVIDDSATPVLDRGAVDGGAGDGSRPWPTARPGGRRQDLYLFAYGDDHPAALHDAARLFGAQPLPPRYALGYWYSRYYAYTDRELEALAARFDEMALPLDVLVIDMDWHLPLWTGYSWDKRYFPDPDDTLRRLRERDIRLTLNLHPADGVKKHEDQFAAMCEAMGLDPRRTDRIPFDCTDPTFVEAYFRLLHHPEEARGVDFWWMDWQQGKQSAIEGLDPLPWLNQLHWDDQVEHRSDERPIIFSRWGGLGGGRYPIGFSGDTWSVWESLAYQPEFTATAANMLYGYWSHDIGGHYGPATTPELYTRWIQFGAYSPILRTHGSKHPEHERRVWEFADPHRSVMIDALHRRYELVPYVYTECRKGVDTGSSLVRPMYHQHPKTDDAYRATGQYQFGDELVVAPVVEPIAHRDRMASARVWLPQGEWYDTAHGQALRVRNKDGEWFDRRYLLEEIPVFARAGAVLPGQRDALRLSSPCYDHLVVTAYPGGDGSYSLYEDDGASLGYLRREDARLPLRHRTTAGSRTITIGPAKGGYDGWSPSRPVEIRVVGTTPPCGVSVDGREVPWSVHQTDGAWSYDADNATVIVRLPSVDLLQRTTVRVDLDPAVSGSVDGLAGLFRRLNRVAQLVGLVSPHYILHEDERLAVDLAQTGNRISRDPSTFTAEMRRLRREQRRLDTVLEEFSEAWTQALVAPFADPRAISVDLLAEARGILATTQEQFA